MNLIFQMRSQITNSIPYPRWVPKLQIGFQMGSQVQIRSQIHKLFTNTSWEPRFQTWWQLPHCIPDSRLVLRFQMSSQIPTGFPDFRPVLVLKSQIGFQIPSGIPETSFNFKLQIKFKIPNEIWVIQMSSLNPDSIPDSRPQIKDGILDTKWDPRFKT